MRFAIFLLVAVIPWSSGLAFDPAEQDDSLALARHFVEPPNPVGPPIEQGSFSPIRGETITLMGGADMFKMQGHAGFDIAMHSAYPEKELKIRNIAWPADTVFRQQRPMYFYTEKGDAREGSVPDLRKKLESGTMVLMFGKMESLAGTSAIPEFSAAYEKLILALKKKSQRIVLVSPVGFGDTIPATHMAGQRNKVLREYAASIRALAKIHSIAFFDLGEFEKDAYASNGLYLSETGKGQLAVRLAKGLGWTGQWYEGLEPHIKRKDLLWDQYYRPTNWAFLFGDRQHVPSSRDDKDSTQRWFVEEIQRIPGFIAETEKEIWKLAGGISK